MYIDPHVHCRDGKQAYKETIAHALSVAERAGLTAIFDMPNTDPSITSRKLVEERLGLARNAHSPVWYGLYMALTADMNQVKEAVETYREFEQVVGFKLYAGHSTGNIGVTKTRDQLRIYSTLRDLGYEGVVALHCEKERLIKKRWNPNKRELVQDWNPEYPVTHAFARPPEAEIESVNDQINFVEYTKFPGTIHVAHISVPEAVDLVQAAKKKGIRITCGTTPHHLLLDMSHMDEPDGLLYKMNPPLRPAMMVEKLFSYLKEGKIDWVETDHAPHTISDKINYPYFSGIPVLPFYPRFIEMLREEGFSEEQIRDLTFNNIVRTFCLDLQSRKAAPSLDITGEYHFDPFVFMKTAAAS